MKITLKNDAKNDQNSKEGVYILESELVNRKPSWSQLIGTNKIWWLDGAKQWCIATKASGFMSDTDVFLLPHVFAGAAGAEVSLVETLHHPSPGIR